MIETCLKSHDPGTAIGLVSEIGPPARFAEPLLTVFAECATDMPTRVKAAAALAKILGHDDVALLRIDIEMQDGFVGLLQLLKNDQSAAKIAIPKLCEKLAGNSVLPLEKEQIIGLLGEVGAPAKAAVPVLHSLAKTTRDTRRQRLIAEALSKIEAASTQQTLNPLKSKQIGGTSNSTGVN